MTAAIRRRQDLSVSAEHLHDDGQRHPMEQVEADVEAPATAGYLEQTSELACVDCSTRVSVTLAVNIDLRVDGQPVVGELVDTE